jgi:hypothetical protein
VHVTKIRAGGYFSSGGDDIRSFVDIYVENPENSGIPGQDKILVSYPLESDDFFTTVGMVPLVVPSSPVTSLVPPGGTFYQCVTNDLTR